MTEQCSFQSCDRDQYAKTYCLMHYKRFWKHGDASIVKKGHRLEKGKSYGNGGAKGSTNAGWKGSSIGYSAAHYRVRAANGPIDNYNCVDCGTTAQQWSYNGLDPDELRGEYSLYSPSVEFYEPRCRHCHEKFDHKETSCLT